MRNILRAGSVTPIVIHSQENVRLDISTDCIGTVEVPGEAVSQALVVGSTLTLGRYLVKREVIVTITQGTVSVIVSTDGGATLSITTAGTVAASLGKSPSLTLPDGSLEGLASESGNYFAKKLRRGAYGRRIASWGSALQNSAGTVALVAGDLPPFVDNATQVLRITQNATTSFGQQSPPDAGQSYMPKGTSPGFVAGIWVKNPGARTLNFEIRFYNVNAAKSIFWNGAIEPTANLYGNVNGWVFITFSPSQQNNQGSWTFGTDVVKFIRVSQKDNGPEGAWLSGENILVGNVYVDPKTRPKFMLQFDDGYSTQRYPNNTLKVSGTAYVASSASNVFTTAAAHTLQVGEPILFTEAAPTSLTVGTTYWVSVVGSTTTFQLATDSTLGTPATSDGFSGTAPYQYAGAQDLSGQQIVERYGFRGSLFIVSKWLGTSGTYGYTGGAGGTFLTTTDVKAMWNEGWSVGSHSHSHPSNNENAGLRLLGPYGYFLSDTYDNLPAAYISAWSITTTTGRRRVTAGTQASPSVFTTENAHQFIVNMPIVFTDVAPTGCTLGVTYYVASVASSTTFTLATDSGVYANKVNNTSGAFSGTCNYRYPGSSNDDSAIYTDINTCIAAIAALGIPTGAKFFALPQGGWDTYVRSGCQRAGVSWVRGISNYNTSHTIPLGLPSGGNIVGSTHIPGGWMQQIDAVQTDGTVAIANLQTYVDATITQGACGCNYHHSVGFTNLVALDQLCSYLRTKKDAGLIEVITLDEHVRDLGI